MSESEKWLQFVAMEAIETLAEYDRNGAVSAAQMAALRAVIASAMIRVNLPAREEFTRGDAADMAAEVRYLISRINTA